MTQPDHGDPFGESGQHVLQRVMALAALTEAASRLYATRRQRSEEIQRMVATDEARLAEQLSRMPLLDLAKTWRSALEGGKDPAAQSVLRLAERALRDRWPDLMQHYDAGRQRGVDPLRAMQAAGLRHAEDVMRGRMPDLMRHYDRLQQQGVPPNEAMRRAWAQWDLDRRSRAHGADASWSAAQPDLSRPALGALNQQQREQLDLLAEWSDPAVRRAWLDRLRAEGSDPATVAWAENLLAHATSDHNLATSQIGEPDIVATPTVDEHTEGLAGAVRSEASANTKAATSAAVDGTKATPAQVARMSFAAPARAALSRPGAGKVIDGQVVAPKQTQAATPARTAGGRRR